MKHFIIYILLVFVPIMGCVALTNYIVDPANIYTDRVGDKLIEGHAKGYNVTNIPDNIDERLYKRRLVELYAGRKFDYLVLGNSRVKLVSSDMFNGKTVLNLGVSGAKLEDIVAFYEICRQNGVTYSNVLFCADPAPLFNENYGDERWLSVSKYYYSFTGGLHFAFDFAKVENLFSISYFQSALKSVRNADKMDGAQELKFAKSGRNDGKTYRTDGSLDYAKAKRETPQSEVDQNASTWMHPMFMDFSRLSEHRKTVFENLMGEFKKDGTNIIFLFSPFHPLFYERISDIRGERMGEKFMRQYADTHHIKIIGNLNPSVNGFGCDDFYDGAHPKSEAMARLLGSSSL